MWERAQDSQSRLIQKEIKRLQGEMFIEQHRFIIFILLSLAVLLMVFIGFVVIPDTVKFPGVEGLESFLQVYRNTCKATWNYRLPSCFFFSEVVIPVARNGGDINARAWRASFMMVPVLALDAIELAIIFWLFNFMNRHIKRGAKRLRNMTFYEKFKGLEESETLKIFFDADIYEFAKRHYKEYYKALVRAGVMLPEEWWSYASTVIFAILLRYRHYPASVGGFHDSSEGGLLRHTLRNLSQSIEVIGAYAKDEIEAKILVALVLGHDIGKVMTIQERQSSDGKRHYQITGGHEQYGKTILDIIFRSDPEILLYPEKVVQAIMALDKKKSALGVVKGDPKEIPFALKAIQVLRGEYEVLKEVQHVDSVLKSVGEGKPAVEEVENEQKEDTRVEVSKEGHEGKGIELSKSTESTENKDKGITSINLDQMLFGEGTKGGEADQRDGKGESEEKTGSEPQNDFNVLKEFCLSIDLDVKEERMGRITARTLMDAHRHVKYLLIQKTELMTWCHLVQNDPGEMITTLKAMGIIVEFPGTNGEPEPFESVVGKIEGEGFDLVDVVFKHSKGVMRLHRILVLDAEALVRAVPEYEERIVEREKMPRSPERYENKMSQVLVIAPSVEERGRLIDEKRSEQKQENDLSLALQKGEKDEKDVDVVNKGNNVNSVNSVNDEQAKT